MKGKKKGVPAHQTPLTCVKNPRKKKPSALFFHAQEGPSRSRNEEERKKIITSLFASGS